MTMTVSRRDFFRQAPAAAVAVTLTSEPPPRAWIVVEENWQYNDEFTYSAGEIAHSTLYYDHAAAEAACAELNRRFQASQTPAEFEIDWSLYFPDGLPDGKVEDEITWEEAAAAGWVDPFSLQELLIPGVDDHE